MSKTTTVNRKFLVEQVKLMLQEIGPQDVGPGSGVNQEDGDYVGRIGDTLSGTAAEIGKDMRIYLDRIKKTDWYRKISGEQKYTNIAMSPGLMKKAENSFPIKIDDYTFYEIMFLAVFEPDVGGISISDGPEPSNAEFSFSWRADVESLLTKYKELFKEYRGTYSGGDGAGESSYDDQEIYSNYLKEIENSPLSNFQRPQARTYPGKGESNEQLLFYPFYAPEPDTQEENIQSWDQFRKYFLDRVDKTNNLMKKLKRAASKEKSFLKRKKEAIDWFLISSSIATIPASFGAAYIAAEAAIGWKTFAVLEILATELSAAAVDRLTPGTSAISNLAQDIEDFATKNEEQTGALVAKLYDIIQKENLTPEDKSNVVKLYGQISNSYKENFTNIFRNDRPNEYQESYIPALGENNKIPETIDDITPEKIEDIKQEIKVVLQLNKSLLQATTLVPKMKDKTSRRGPMYMSLQEDLGDEALKVAKDVGAKALDVGMDVGKKAIDAVSDTYKKYTSDNPIQTLFNWEEDQFKYNSKRMREKLVQQKGYYEDKGYQESIINREYQYGPDRIRKLSQLKPGIENAIGFIYRVQCQGIFDGSHSIIKYGPYLGVLKGSTGDNQTTNILGIKKLDATLPNRTKDNKQSLVAEINRIIDFTKQVKVEGTKDNIIEEYKSFMVVLLEEMKDSLNSNGESLIVANEALRNLVNNTLKESKTETKKTLIDSRELKKIVAEVMNSNLTEQANRISCAKAGKQYDSKTNSCMTLQSYEFGSGTGGTGDGTGAGIKGKGKGNKKGTGTGTGGGAGDGTGSGPQTGQTGRGDKKTKEDEYKQTSKSREDEDIFDDGETGSEPVSEPTPTIKPKLDTKKPKSKPTPEPTPEPEPDEEPSPKPKDEDWPDLKKDYPLPNEDESEPEPEPEPSVEDGDGDSQITIPGNTKIRVVIDLKRSSVNPGELVVSTSYEWLQKPSEEGSDSQLMAAVEEEDASGAKKHYTSARNARVINKPKSQYSMKEEDFSRIAGTAGSSGKTNEAIVFDRGAEL